MKIKSNLFVWVIIALLWSACEPRNANPSGGNPSDEIVNHWIYENMGLYYYWNEKLPRAPQYSQNPPDFFSSLLYRYNIVSRPDGDRFSWIQESAEELKSSLSGQSKSTGLNFSLYIKSAGSDEIIGVVLYVLPESPAAKSGVKRGDIFTKINGQVLTRSNYNELLYRAEGAKKYSFSKLDDNANDITLLETGEKTLEAITLQENPVFLDTVYTIGTKKVGYLVYNQFNPGPSGVSNSDVYDKAVDNFIGGLKSAGVSDFILDFRYNGGGYVSSARNLASLLAKGVTNKDIFSYKEYNTSLSKTLEKEYGKDYFNDYFLNKSQNIGGLLNRVFVLTSKSTASASELTINGLKPYMQVVIVGDTTVGKNVGSITLADNSKKIKWGIQPIVSKSFNSKGNSDYSGGFAPDIYVREGIKLFPLGDPADRHLGAVFEYITGGDVNARKITQKRSDEATLQQFVEIDNSIGRKTNGYNMFEDDPFMKER
jgi:carboxyl-terminal processing protease